MAAHNEANARQLDFTYEGPTDLAPRATAAPCSGSPPLCVVCSRVPAHLTIVRDQRHLPARLCLRCHHAVRKQRQMLRASLDADDARLRAGRENLSSGIRQHHRDSNLILPRATRLSPAAKYSQLIASRRRAQKAARHALRS